jgi:hypothetical protein
MKGLSQQKLRMLGEKLHEAVLKYIEDIVKSTPNKSITLHSTVYGEPVCSRIYLDTEDGCLYGHIKGTPTTEDTCLSVMPFYYTQDVFNDIFAQTEIVKSLKQV